MYNFFESISARRSAHSLVLDLNSGHRVDILQASSYIYIYIYIYSENSTFIEMLIRTDTSLNSHTCQYANLRRDENTVRNSSTFEFSFLHTRLHCYIILKTIKTHSLPEEHPHKYPHIYTLGVDAHANEYTYARTDAPSFPILKKINLFRP